MWKKINKKKVEFEIINCLTLYYWLHILSVVLVAQNLSTQDIHQYFVNADYICSYMMQCPIMPTTVQARMLQSIHINHKCPLHFIVRSIHRHVRPNSPNMFHSKLKRLSYPLTLWYCKTFGHILEVYGGVCIYVSGRWARHDFLCLRFSRRAVHSVAAQTIYYSSKVLSSAVEKPDIIYWMHSQQSELYKYSHNSYSTMKDWLHLFSVQRKSYFQESGQWIYGNPQTIASIIRLNICRI